MPTFIPAHSLRTCGAALLALIGLACSSAPSSATLAQQIQAEVGDAACDGPQQCHSIGVGSKSCGGPASYLAWSSKKSDGARLKALVERQRAEQREQDARDGRMSNCALVPDPGASCMAGQCRLNTGGNGLR
jgi:hypothetical protein